MSNHVPPRPCTEQASASARPVWPPTNHESSKLAKPLGWGSVFGVPPSTLQQVTYPSNVISLHCHLCSYSYTKHTRSSLFPICRVLPSKTADGEDKEGQEAEVEPEVALV